jgi:hypothetical protein
LDSPILDNLRILLSDCSRRIAKKYFVCVLDSEIGTSNSWILQWNWVAILELKKERLVFFVINSKILFGK